MLADLDRHPNASLTKWNKMFEYLIKQEEKTNNLSFIYAFTDFYKKKIHNLKSNNIKIKQLETKIKQLDIKIEIAHLPSPKYLFHPDTSLRALYKLDKQECFKYGWELFQNVFIINRTKISHYKLKTGIENNNIKFKLIKSPKSTKNGDF